jgi:ethanolamine ammonia-lyase small subunit
MKALIAEDPWLALRRFTTARIALGRAGQSLPTRAVLEFGLAHAQARDAVHLPLDCSELAASLDTAGFASVAVHSAAPDRATYLRRPDLGRRLDEASRQRLGGLARPERPDLVFVIADGLSSCAAATHVVPLLLEVVPLLPGWRLAPVVIAEQGRVALGDEVGEILGAALAVMLIGERPGLSSPDSLGIYLTYGPRLGRTDAERNCISNVRPAGLGYAQAARRLVFLLTMARQLKLSGVGLTDDSGPLLPGG